MTERRWLVEVDEELLELIEHCAKAAQGLAFEYAHGEDGEATLVAKWVAQVRSQPPLDRSEATHD